MRRLGVFLSICILAGPSLDARYDGAGCGTTQDTSSEVLFLHRLARRLRPRTAAAASTNRDIGNVAIVEASPGVVETLNQFNLGGYTLTFTPARSAATTYRSS